MELHTIGDNSGDVYLIGPEGRSGRYTNMGNGIFAPTSGLTTRLVLSGGVYTATFADQTKWTFDGNGHLTGLVDRYGNQSSLAYNSSGQLQTISDPAGRAGVGAGLTLGYDTSGRLHSVTDWASRHR